MPPILQKLVKRFVATRLVGIDLGSTTVKSVEVAQGGGRPILRHCAVAPVNGEGAATVLKQLASQANLRNTDVAFGVASPEVVVKPFQFPPMPRKELPAAIQCEAEQAILNGHTMDDMALDWHVWPSDEQAPITGLLAVVPRAILEHRLQAAVAAGLRPFVVDVEGLALWNAYWTLAPRHRASSSTVMLVNIGAKVTNVVIARTPNELILLRDVQLGGEALAAGQEQEWIDEIRDSLVYARANGGLRQLDVAYVTGGGCGASAVRLVESVVKAPVEGWDPLAYVDVETQLPTNGGGSVGPSLTIAIGLALRQLR